MVYKCDVYKCDLETGQTIYLENQGDLTTIALVQMAPGQQQQSSSRFTTGAWVAQPQLFQTLQGVQIKLTTHPGDVWIQVQGQTAQMIQHDKLSPQAQPIQIHVTESMPGTGTSLPPIQPLSPMKPMTMGEPMTLGNMQMSGDSMQMHLGNMSMKMGPDAPRETRQAASESGKATRRFCTQCGEAIASDDRFCGACGHSLTR